nr:hypothetical protein [Tanacetum cinerariifolium]
MAVLMFLSAEFDSSQFCDADLEVAFRRNTCFIRDLDGVDLLKGKSKRASHPPKPVPNSKQRLHLLHMDLCGPMRVASINAPVIIVRTDNGTEFKNHVLNEYFDSVGITYETSAAKPPQQNRVVERRNRTLVDAARTTLIFSHASLFLWAENDCEDIDKLGAKGDIGFFIGYSANSVAYRVPSECDMDILFEPLHNEYLGGRPSVAPRAIPAAPQQRNLTPSPTASAADNVPNAMFKGDLFVNPFATPSTESVVSSTQYVDPSNMHTFYQPYPHDYQWTKDHPLDIMEPKSVKESLTDPAWIKPCTVGLKQAPRAWYDELSTFLPQNRFSKGIIDPTLFTRRFDDDILVDSGFELTGFWMLIMRDVKTPSRVLLVEHNFLAKNS